VQPHFSFTSKYNGRASVLATEVSIHETNSNDNHTKIVAIWDTGATGSAITTKLVQSLGLVPTGMKEVHTANGICIQNTYIVDITLPNNVKIVGQIVTEIPSLSGGMDALIGMDIIAGGDFSITNVGGKTVMSFRMPSFEEIDYVKHPPALPQKPRYSPQFKPPQSKNSPCPCGSGKQYKRCHGLSAKA
jgi:hypothetical protein